MPQVLGFHVSKGQMRYAVLDGTIQSPVMIDKDRLVTVDPKRVPQLMDWFESQFIALLDKYEPAKIAYRLTLAPSKEQLFTSEFPFGILNLLAHRRDIPIFPFSAQSFIPSKIERAKGVDIYQECDTAFGKHPPYWDTNQKHAILAAWFVL